MKKTIQWIILVWSILGAIYNLTDPYLAWDATLLALLYGGLVIGVTIDDLKGK